MSYKFSKQDGIKDCGVCVLYNMIRYYGGYIDIEELRNLVKTTKDGTSVYHIVETSKKLGLDSKSYKCSINDLCNIQKPFVAHIKVENKYPHYVIVQKIIDDEIFLFDPIRGDIKYSLELFSEEWTNIIITFEKTSNLVKKENKYKNYLLNNIINNKISIFLLIFLSIVCTFFTSVNSFFFQTLLDNINNIDNYFYIFIILMIISVLISYMRNKYIINYSNNLDSKLTYDIYKQILYLPLSYHHSRPTGDVVSRIYDLNYIKNFINELSFSLIVYILLFIIISIFFIFSYFDLFIIAFIFIIFYTLIYLLFRRKINNLSLISREWQSNVNSVLVENLVGIDTIKNLNLEEFSLNKQKEMYNTFLRYNKKLNYSYNIFNNFLNIIMYIQMIFCMYIGVVLIKNNQMKVSELISFVLLLNIYQDAIKNLFSIDNLIIDSKNSYKRLNQLFHSKKALSISNIKFKNNIKFVDVKYSYNNVYNNLSNFNLEINKNDYILVTGISGVGKSTIFKLLTKQLEIQEGKILLDNHSISEFSDEYIRNKICYVSQNEFIFTDTILNNIKLDKTPSKKELEKALKVSMLDKVLKNKNIDLNYMLEEDGHNLSGGERQKVLIARTLIRDADFIIFDETMNEIDIDSERKILEKIKAEYKKTIILISHRENNKDLFNKHIVVREGEEV